MVYCVTEMGVYEADTLEHLKEKVGNVFFA